MTLTETDITSIANKLADKIEDRMPQIATSKHFETSCGKFWDRKSQALADVITGEDINTSEGRSRLRSVYENSKLDMDNKKLIGKTIMLKIVDLLIIGTIVLLGLKASM